jgi:hypothetical protein
MPGARRHLDPEADPALGTPARRPARGGGGPAVAALDDPRLAHAGGAPGLLHLQRMAGNSAVASLVAPSVQRVVEIDEVSTDVGGGPAAPAPDGTGGEPASGGEAAGGPTTITGSSIELDAPVTTSPGIIRADTIVANSVIASNYTPGAGNTW